jgi:uncharacterized protein (UPF0332 family)
MNHSKKEYIIYRVNRSLVTFDDAKILFREKRWNSCMNRIYYAAFYAVNALLFSIDINSKTHNGVRRMFGKEFIKSGKIDKKYGKFIQIYLGAGTKVIIMILLSLMKIQ